MEGLSQTCPALSLVGDLFQCALGEVLCSGIDPVPELSEG